jgi:hypothetical protein
VETIRTVNVVWPHEVDPVAIRPIAPVSVDVVVGDGSTDFFEDGEYPVDPRIFFYFVDLEEYRSAFVEDNNMFGFRIVSEENGE